MSDTNEFYVYLHRRASDNNVFYVGKGKGKRAWDKHGRNDWWKRIFDKHGRVVEIVFDNLSEEDAFSIEKEVILEMRHCYGRNICNMTKGGEGIVLDIESKKTIYCDGVEHTFVSKDLEVFVGTRQEFSVSKRLDISRIGALFREDVSNRPHSVFGWGVMLHGETPSDTVYRMNNGRADKRKDQTLHRFINKETREVLTVTREVLANLLGVTTVRVGALFNKRAFKTVAGWGVVLPNESDEDAFIRIQSQSGICRGDKRIHKFKHKDGTVFIGTRKELCEKYGVNIRHLTGLFSMNPKPSIEGWSLVEGET